MSDVRDEPLSVSKPGGASSPPLVAVVTPVYNGAKFLAEVMDTVQAQTYPNLVHIVHDNASTDATPAIIARYANARVPVLVERNDHTVSLHDNWNLAVARVPKEAKYFRILCADDFMAPTFISRLAQLMERNPSVIVTGCDLRPLSNPDERWDSHWDDDRSVFSGKEAIGRFFLGKGVIVVIHALVRRDALDLRKPFIDASLLISDTDMCLDLLRHGDWGFVHEELAVANDHAGSVTSAVARPSRMDASDMLVLLERYAPDGLGEERAQATIRQYKRYYLRQLLLWRLVKRDTFDRHIGALKAAGRRSRFDDVWEIADAIVDWGLLRLRMREPWAGLRGF